MSEEAVQQALVEAILYLETEGVSIGKLSKKTSLSKEKLEHYLSIIQTECSQTHRGVELVCIASRYRLIPKRKLHDYLRLEYAQYKREDLSRAAMETLAIIAYRQPISRARIETIRGVNVTRQLQVLLSRLFIRKETPKDETRYGVVFVTTKTFLEQFGMRSLQELPTLDEIDLIKFNSDKHEAATT